ncbi:MAG: cytochrome c biogenesis protein ResB [Spirochaetales bacterium]|nr:cytochrome c biogenesis protein ResB [Spirochaetales bacterium]
MKALLDFLKSVKLAVVLIGYITITSIMATLVPQGREVEYYLHNYPDLLSWLIVNTGFHQFFRSLLFLIPAVFFFVNLSVCTIDRFVREIRGKKKKRFGPDILHAGLLLLVIASLITALTRQESQIFMAEREQYRIQDKYVIGLNSFETQLYADGRPKDWISRIDVFKDDDLLVHDFPIEVNSPLSVDGMMIYQVDFSEQDRVLLGGENKDVHSLAVRDFFKSNGEVFSIDSISVNSANAALNTAGIRKWTDQSPGRPVIYKVSDKVGAYEILKISREDLTGLQIIKDPGAVPVVIALLIITLGLCVTFLQKIGEKNL